MTGTITRGLLRRMREEAGLLFGLMLVSLLALGFLGIADEMVEGDLAAFDTAVTAALHWEGAPFWFAEMIRDVTALGSTVVLGLILAAACLYLLLVRRHGAALLMAVAVLGGTLASTLLKSSYDRPRPDLAQAMHVFNPSFPSGHATLSAITYLTIGILLARQTSERLTKLFFIGIALFLTLAVGLSRISLGVHFPSDVLAGWCLGSAWAILCWAVALRLQFDGTLKPAAPGYSLGVTLTGEVYGDPPAPRLGNDRLSRDTRH